MAASKNITIRLSYDDLELFNNMATRLGIDRTALIRRAVKAYDGAIPKKTIQETTEEILNNVSVTEERISVADLKHPLLDVIQKTGIAIQDNDGKELARLKSLPALLDFVHKNVFNLK